MAETFLRSVHDAVNREYDYIIVGTPFVRFAPDFLDLDPNASDRWWSKDHPSLALPPTHSAGSHTQTAGLVVATRLTEDPTVSVLVLEAGRANLNDDSISTCSSATHHHLILTTRIAMPGTFGKNFFQPDYEWGFMTVGIGTNHGDALLTLFLCSCFQIPQKHSSDTPFYWPR
jgi:hypothetical protein